MSGADLRGPSTKNFQQQYLLRDKNYQSDTVKQSLSQQMGSYESSKGRPLLMRNPELPIKTNNSGPVQERTMINPPSSIKAYGGYLEQKKASLNGADGNQPQSRFESRQSQSLVVREAAQRIVGNNPQIVRISERSNMYDFRKASSRGQFMYETALIKERALRTNDSNNNLPSSTQMKAPLGYFGNRAVQGNHSLKPPLTPIKENENAIISNLPPPSRNIDDPDNNILFLDNESRIINPLNAKTPPPPMWGEVLEEENYNPNDSFYDHSKAQQEMKRRKFMEMKRDQHNRKLKRKVIYVYEDESEDEKNGISQIREAQSVGAENRGSQHQRMNTQKFQYIPALANSSRRGVTSELHHYNDTQQSQSSSAYKLPQVQRANPYPILKPQHIAPQSSLPSQAYQTSNSNRQIRTGGFSKLPTILNTLAKPQQ